MKNRPLPRVPRLAAACNLLACLALFGMPVASYSADLYWDTDTSTTGNDVDGTGLGGAGNWDTTTSNWWDLTNLVVWPNSSADRAIFSYAYSAGVPTYNTVTLDSGILANQLSFLRSGYTLTGGDLTLAGTTPTLFAGLGESATIASQILGTAGLTMTGGGAIRLTNTSNNYTGTTTIDGGILSISDQAALGSDLSAIVVNGSATRGFGGGALRLEGGVTLSRGVSLQGLGPVGSNGSALISVGNNSITGALTNGSGLVNTTISSAAGRLAMGDVTLAGTAGTTFLNAGSGNGTGTGSYSITGTLSGTGGISKTGGGMLVLSPTSATGWSGILQASAGSIRVSDTAALGTSAATNAIDLNGGTLELRTDSTAFTSAKRVNLNNGGTVDLLLDHAIGSTVLNQTFTFANFDYDAGETMNITTRDGFGASFTAATAIGNGTGDTTLTNTGSGLVTYNGTVWGNTNTTARTFTVNGTGNTTLTGSITASGAAHTFVKSGTGTVTVTGTASTYTGATTTSGGALVITDFRTLNGNTGATNSAAINIGSTTTAGILSVGTSTAATAAGLTLLSGKAINLNGTTGGATINANQSFAAPVILNGIASTGAGTKILTLGGTSTQNNIVNGVISNNNATNLTHLVKADSGTWVLAGTNTYTGYTQVTNGVLKLSGTTVLNDSAGFTFGQNATTLSAGGTLSLTANSGTETIGLFTPVSGAGTVSVTGTSGVLSIATMNGTTQNTTAASSASSTVTVGSTAGLVPGMLITGTGVSSNAVISAITSSTTFTASATQTIGNGVTLTFSRPTGVVQNSGSTVNFTPGTGSVVVGSVPAIGLLNAYSYFNGSNFAYAPATTNATLRAPVYGTDSGFNTVAASAALTASSNNQITSSSGSSGVVTQGSTVTVPTIKLATGTTLTANALVTLQAAANSPGGILLSGGSATINGSSGITSGGTGDVVIRTDLSGDTLTLSATGGISSTTTGGLTKTGAGTLVISSTNAQTGTTNINEGKIQLSGTGKISGNSAGLSIRQGATLDLNGVTMSGTAIGAFNGAGTIANANATAVTLSVGNGNGTGTFSGTFNQTSGVINVTKNGTGAQTWSGTSNYTGVTTIASTGIVSVATLANIGSDSSIGRGDSTSDAANAASLVFSGTTGGIAYTGSNSVSIDRLFTMSGGGQISNNSAINAALVLNKTNAINFGTTASQTLTLGGSSIGDNQINLQLVNPSSGTLGLSKIGAGLWILGNSSNSYTGTTQIGLTTTAGGVLQAIDGSTLPNASYLLLGGTTGGGVFQSSGNFTRNIGTSAAANTVSFNTTLTSGAVGFAASDSKLVVALGGLATPTNLTWGSGGFMGVSGTSTGAFVLGSSTSLAEVEVRNAIDLNGGNRTIQADDNTSTAGDFATITGVISGTGSLTKTGVGTLQLFGANTYSGTTAVTAASTLVVNSLGNSGASGVGTSVGSSTGANLQANAITLGNAGTTAGILQYVGPGETSDRMIRLNTTTGSTQIHADGTGPLILTNVLNDMATGAKPLYLRGSNAQGNAITSTLADNGGALGITVDGGATWTFPNANTYTGITSVSGGALGAGNDNSFGTGTLRVINGAVFAYGSDRTIANQLEDSSTTTATTATFIGDYSINLTSPTWTHTNTTAGQTISNGITTGKTLTIGGDLQWNSLTGNVTQTFTGPGDTILNGSITTSTAFNLGLTLSGPGSLTLSGTASDMNGGAVTLSGGTLKLGNSEVIPHGAVANTTTTAPSTNSTTVTVASTAGLVVGQVFTGTGVAAGSTVAGIVDGTTFTASAAQTLTSGTQLLFDPKAGNVTMSPAAGATATLDLNGKSETINGLTANAAGTTVIDNISATAASLTFGANNQNVDFGSGSGTYTISNTGGGALSIKKTGSGTATISTGVTLTYQGTTESDGGGSFTIASPVNGTSGLKVTGNSTLALTGGLTSPGVLTSVEVGGGSTLSLLDGAGSLISNLTSLNLGAGAGTATLNLNIGDGATDTLTLLTGYSATLANTVTFNMTDAGLSPLTTYTLLNLVDGGITAFGSGNMIQGATPGGFTAPTWTVTDKLVQITTGNLIVGDLFWRGLAGGGTNDTWNGNVNNWSQVKDNSLVATSIPGQGTDVIFAIDSASGAVATTLEQNFKINSLVFEAGTTTPTSISIAPGAVSTNRLEVAPQVATDGVAITAGGPASVTISAPFKLGANQSWNVADAASVLTFSGALMGEKDVTKSGSGKVILSAAADATFNVGQTADFTVSAGNLEFTNSAALGTTAGSNLAKIISSGGGFYYNNATAATLPHDLTLSGGTLSGGGANHTYSGPVNVSAASFINMADSNGPATNTARNITLSGIVSGSGNLTIDSNNTDSGGNQIGGTLAINNAGGTWNGDLFFNRGTVTIGAAASPTVTPDDVTFNSFGRLILQGVDAQTLSRAGTLNLAAGAVGEFQVDNTTGTQVTDFTVDQNGVVNLGSGGTGASLRVALVDALAKVNLTGGVTLGGNSSISLSNSAARLLTISSVIGDSGSGYSLAINDDAGGWAQTNGTVRLTALNTFSGNVSVGDGTLEFNTVTNSTGGASALGNGTAISMAGGTLSFIGSSSQSTNRPITTTGGVTLAANGTGGATITYTGAITQGIDNQLTLTGTNAATAGFITGGIIQTGTAADLNVNSGNWTLSGSPVTIADNVIVTGATAALNLNTTGILNFLDNTNYLYIRGGATVNLGANETITAGVFDGFLLGDDRTGGAFLNTNTYTITGLRLDLGNRNTGYEAQIDGTGTVLVNGTGTSDGINVYRGTVNANLASAGNAFEKYSSGTVTLRGNNSGLTTASNIYEGTLILDYTASNTSKLASAAALDMRGGILSLLGNNSAATSQSVSSFTLASGGSSTIQVSGGTGQNAVLNLGAITRGTLAQDGTVRFILPSGTQSTSNGVTTTSPNSLFGLLGTGSTALADPAYATVADGTGTWFATRSGSNIVALVSTPKDDVSTWLDGDHITDNTGFTGTLGSGLTNINSLRFNDTSASGFAVNANGILVVGSGGVLLTSNVGGTPSITGGTLASGAGELVITQDSSQTFAIGSGIRLQTGVTKAGTGTLQLSGTNDFWGQTEIQEGIVQLAGGSAIGDNSLVTLATYRSSTLQLLANETIGRLAGGQRNTESDYGLVDLGSHTLTINESASTSYAGRFTGSGTVKMNTGSTGNLNLTGSSTGFTGGVIVNGGLFQLSGASGRIDASSFTINKGGNLLIDNNGDQLSTRILDTTPITLNSADGTFSGQTIVRGLGIRINENATVNETVGVLNFNSGASYLSGEASGTTGVATLLANNFVRANNATLSVRGRALGLTAGDRNQFRIGDATNQTNFIATLVGGGGAAASQNISIVPWAIGENLTGALADGNMGNSLVTYVSGAGFRPLDFTTEYDTLAAPAATDNVRESRSTDLTGLGNATVNSLVIDNQATTGLDVTGSGGGYILGVTSGAMLFTVSGGADSTAYDTTLGGFDGGITVGGSNEYIFHVVNPSSAATTPTLTATISSPLTSTADITKSGRGTLILTGTNTAGGGSKMTTLNEGALQIADLDNIGGNTGAIIFAGGTLRLGAGLTDDVSIRPMTFLQGGGTIDTNSVNLVLANAIGNGGPGGFTKAGAGTLTLNAAANWQGSTTVSGGTLTMGVVNAITPEVIVAGGTLDMGSLSPTFTNLTLGPGAGSTLAGSGALTVSNVATLYEGTVNSVLTGPMNLIKRGAGLTASLDGIAHTYTGYTWIQDGTLSVSALANLGATSSPLGAPTSYLNSPIYLGFEASTNATLRYTGAAAASTDRPIILTGTTGDAFIDSDAAGLLTMNGEAYGMTPGTKELTLQGSNGNGTTPNVFAGVISDGSAVLGLTKLGTGTWRLSNTNTYTGTNTVTGGLLQITGSVNNSPTGVGGATNIGNTAGSSGSLDIPTGGSLTTDTIAVGSNTTGIGSLVIRGGSISTTDTGSTQTGISVGTAGYGALLMSGGSITTGRISLYNSATGTGVVQLSGGYVDNNEYLIMSNFRSEFTITGGTLDRNGASQNLAIAYNLAGTSVMNIVGGTVDNTGRSVSFGQGTSTGKGILNLNGGTLTTNSFTVTGTPSATINFNGGTLKAAVDSTTFVPSSASLATYVYAGGAVIDSNGKTITIPSNLLSPAASSGVTGLTLGTAGSGYIGAPYVEIVRDPGDTTGTGATGYATIDSDPTSATYGQLTGVFLTNPGTGYTATPTINLVGGGGTGASVTASGITANSSGGLTKTGLGTLNLTGANTYTGVTGVTGGTLNLNSALTSTSGLSATTGGTVNVNSGFGGGFDLGTVTVGVGSTLNFFNNAADNAALDALTGLNLGAGASGAATLGLELGADTSPYDSLVTSAVAAIANTVNFNVVPLAGFNVGTYTLLTGGAGSGFNSPSVNYTFTLPAGYAATTTLDDTFVKLNVATSSAHSELYWLGGIDAKWGSFDGGGNSNWTTDLTGLTHAQASPDATTTAYFSTSNIATAGTLATTLEQPFTLNGLVFNNQTNSGALTAITIAPGTAGTLTLTPSAPTAGISVQTGAPAAVTISAPLALGAAQTWTVADSGSLLSLSGIVSGGLTNSNQTTPAANTSLTVKGSGAVGLTNIGNTFTGDILVDGGTLRIGDLAGWGGPTVASSTSKTITLDNGGTLNITSGTLNPGSLTTTSYKLVQIGTGGGTIDIASGAGLTLDDAGQLFGSGALIKSGLGTLSLRNQGTSYGGFTGAITVTAGTLQPSGGTGFNFGTTAAGTIIQSGAALNVNGISVSEAEPVTISGTGLTASPAGVITNSSGTAGGLAGPITLGNHATIGAAAAGGLTLSGGITGAYDLTIQNLAAGGTTLSTTSVNNAGTITNSGTGTGGTTINAVIGSNVTGIVQNSTTSALTLSANNALFSGPITIKAGTLTGNLVGVATTLGDGSVTNTITIGDSAGSSNATLAVVNNVTYLQNIQVASGNTGLATIVAGTTTGSPVLSGSITLNNHDVILSKSGTTGNSQFAGGISGTGNITIHNVATSTGTITLATGAVNPNGSITHTSTASGATTISADIGSNVTSLTQSSATSALTLSGATIAYTGATTVSAGTLNITGSASGALATNAVSVAGGATLNLINSAGQALTSLSALSLGAGSGTTNLGLELGSASAYDRLGTSAVASVANAVRFNITALSGFGSSLTYDLLTAPSGLTTGGATYSLGYMPGGYTYTLTPGDGLVQLGLTALGAGNYYWHGNRANQSWAEVVAGDSNWSTDLGGTLDPGASPGSLNTVIFSSSAASGPTISTTLDNNYFINDIQFTTNPTGVTAVSIAPGTVASNSLTIAPATATDGIDVAANAGTVTISAPVVVGANQEWDVDATGASLLVSGALSGSADLTKAGTGTLTLSGSTDSYSGDITIGAGSLNFAPTGAYTVSGLISGSGALTKSASGTTTLSQSNTYLGATNVDAGSLLLGTSNALPTGTVVRLGTGSTAGTLDLNGYDQAIASLSVQSTSNSVTNNLIVDTGNTLTVNGAVTLGIDANASDTNINASGGGSVVVNSGGANFIVGAATGATNDSRVDADFSGLTNFTANLGAGVFRLGDVNTGTETNPSTFKLAVNNTITASAIRVGDGAGGGATHTLTLGSGTNLLNADTLNIGSAGTGFRSGGAVVFAGGDTTGALTLRASDGSSRDTVNMVNTTGNTGSAMDATLNLAGHTADILASTLTMASRTQGAGAGTATLSFDQGTLDVTTLNMASRTSTGTGGATATVNLGDSAAPGTPTATIGALAMAVNTSAGGTVTADLNVTGGNVTIGTGSGTAINMANAGASRTVTSTIDLTGGTVDVTGNIVRTGGAGTENATVTLAGSTLDMNANSIGTAGSTISFAAQSGTLQNLGELNGGGALTKTTTGILNLEGTNSYSGDTTISAGTLKLGASGVIPDGSGKGNVVFNPASGTATLDLGGFSETINGLSSSGAGSSVVDNTTGTGIYTLTVGGNNQTSTFGGTIQNSSGTVALTKTGTGTLTLSGASTYDGVTTISQGVVILDPNTATLGSTAAGTVVQSGAQLRLMDTNFVLNENLTLSGSGTNATGGGNGALGMQENSGVITYNGLITLDGGATLGSFNAGTATLTVAQGITGTGDLTIRPGAANNGTSNWYLNGQSSYTGNTVFSTANVNGTATIRNGIDNALPTGSALFLNGTAGATVSTTLTYMLNGYNQTVAGLSGANGTSGPYTYQNTVVGGSATLSTLTVNNTTDSTFGGTLGGSNPNDNNLALNKEGAGALLLNGTNTYTGNTTVKAGTLGGEGSIAGNIEVQGNDSTAGTLTAGTATGIGTLTVGSGTTVSATTTGTNPLNPTWLVNLTLTAGVGDWGAGGAGGGLYVDLIDSSGAIDPTNFTLDIQDTLTGFQWGDKYRIANYGTGGWTSGNYFENDYEVGGQHYIAGANHTFEIFYNDSNGFTLMAVPEPETWVPVLVALALGLFLNRRRRMTVAIGMRH